MGAARGGRRPWASGEASVPTERPLLQTPRQRRVGVAPCWRADVGERTAADAKWLACSCSSRPIIGTKQFGHWTISSHGWQSPQLRGVGTRPRAHESNFGRFYRKAVMRKYRQRKRNVASSKRQKIVPAVHRATGALIKGVRAQPWSLWRRAARPWPFAAPRLPRHGLSRRYPYCRARAPRSCPRRSRHRVPTCPRRPWPPDLRG